ncbi:MAG: PAS domain S-box protein [Pirellulales bacterium]
MATLDSSSSKSQYPHQLNRNPHKWSAVRIAGSYLLRWPSVDRYFRSLLGGIWRIDGHRFLSFSLERLPFRCFVRNTGLSKRRREISKHFANNDALSVVEGTSDAVFVKDCEGKYLLLNSAGAKFIGKQLIEILGRDDRAVFGEEDGKLLLANDRSIMNRGEVDTLEETLTSAGVTRTYQATKAPYFDSSGKIAGIIGISRDATDRTQVEQALRETDARLREAQRIAKLGSWSWEPSTNKVWWSNAEFELLGVNKQAVHPSFEAFLARLHPEDRAIAIARVEAMLSGANEFANDLRVVRDDGSYFWIRSQARATRGEDGTILRVEGIDQDITAQVQAREAIENSERQLQAAVELAQLGIMAVDYEHGTVSLSSHAAEQFGFEPSLKVTRSELHSRFHPDDKEYLNRLIRLSLEPNGNHCFAVEHRVVRPDGSIRWLNVRKQVSFVDRKPHSAVVVTADVTDRRAAEARFREQEMLVREAAELAKVGGWGFDPNTLQVDWTAEVARIYGLPEDAPPGLNNAFDFFLPEHRPTLEAAISAAIQDGIAHDLEVQLIDANGEHKWVRTICRPIVDAGRVVRVRGSLQDITDRKRVESELRASEERYRMLFESNPHPMWVFDLDTFNFLEVNEAAVQGYGFSRQEFLQMTIRDIRPADDIPKLEMEIAHSGIGFHQSVVWRHKKKNGTIIDVDISSYDLPDIQRKSRLVLALDITDRIRAEAELKASERRLRLALEAAGASAFVWEIPNDNVIRYYSPGSALPPTAELLGTLTELRSRIHPADLAKFDARLNECLASGSDYYNEYRVLRPDGSKANLEEYGYLDRGPNGEPLRLTGMSIDVTERVSTTDSLQVSEERLRVALKGAKGGVWDWDLTTSVAWWSPEMYELMGAPASLVTDEPKSVELIHPEDRERVRTSVANAILNRTDYHCEFRVQNGKRWLSSHASVSLDSTGTPNRLVGISWDVTERVLATEALKLSELKYRRLVDLLPTSIFIYAEDKILFANPALLKLIGTSNLEDLMNRSPFDLLNSNSHDLFRQRQDEILRTKEPTLGFEVEGLHGDGRIIPLYAVAAPVESYGANAILVALSDLTERERMLALLRSVLNSVEDAIFTVDNTGIITSVNKSAERLFGYAESELLSLEARSIFTELNSPQNSLPAALRLPELDSRNRDLGREVKGVRNGGKLFPAELTITEFSRDGQPTFTWVIHDITIRRQLEEQLRQAQKMEAVGRLAGGVAHDFNNLLTVINGYAEILISELETDHPMLSALNAIRDAGDRAARLTQQLLAFSRKSVVEPKVVDLNSMVAESASLLRRLIGEDIELLVVADSFPVRVIFDPGQLEQVLMNLVVNSRDAMPTGGTLKIETRALQISADSVGEQSNIHPGRYAMLQVTDSGCGISAIVKDKIFEPFFTTKGIGKGTGLGLAVVHGIVEQAGGTIKVDSIEGSGTTFSILLPMAVETSSKPVYPDSNSSIQGCESIIVVEDEDAVRNLIRLTLEGYGYQVQLASDGLDALEWIRSKRDEVQLLITDMVMPGMSGRDLAAKARQLIPNLRVIYMSGYTDDALSRFGLPGTTDQFVQKPFTPLTLVKKVRNYLDGKT